MNPLLHFLLAMYAFTFSGSLRLQFLCRLLSRFPVALIVVSAYAFFFMYQSVFVMSLSLSVGDDVKIDGDVVVTAGDDVAVPV